MKSEYAELRSEKKAVGLINQCALLNFFSPAVKEISRVFSLGGIGQLYPSL